MINLVIQNLQTIVSVATCLVILIGLLGGRKITKALKELKSVQPAVQTLVQSLDNASDEAKANIDALHSAAKTGGKKLADTLNSAGIVSENLEDARNSAAQTLKSLSEREDACLQTMIDLRGAIKYSEEVKASLASTIEEAEKARRAFTPPMASLKDDSAPEESEDITTSETINAPSSPQPEAPPNQESAAHLDDETPALGSTTTAAEQPDASAMAEADMDSHEETVASHAEEDAAPIKSASEAIEAEDTPHVEIPVDAEEAPITSEEDTMKKTAFLDVLPTATPTALSKPRPYLKALHSSENELEAAFDPA